MESYSWYGARASAARIRGFSIGASTREYARERRSQQPWPSALPDCLLTHPALVPQIIAGWNSVRLGPTRQFVGPEGRVADRVQHILNRCNGILENGAQRAFGHVTGIVRNRGVSVQVRVEPDLMRTGRLAMEFHAERLQSLDEVPVAEARQCAHQMA